MNDWPIQVWAAITAAVGGIAGFLGNRSGNRADAAATLTDGALRIVQELQDENARIRERLPAIEEEQHRERVAFRAEREQHARDRARWERRMNQLIRVLHDHQIDVPPETLMDDGVPGTEYG